MLRFGLGERCFAEGTPAMVAFHYYSLPTVAHLHYWRPLQFTRAYPGFAHQLQKAKISADILLHKVSI